MNKAMRFIAIITILGLSFLLMNTISKSKIQHPTNKELEKDTLHKTSKNVSPFYEVKAPKIPEYLELAGERVPTERYDIRERMDKELLVNTYWQSNAMLLIKRAHKYFPIIEPLLVEYELPDDFKYLAVAESGLENNRSYAGAAGFWQFLRGTAREYGLEVNKNVDERYNLEKATKMAAKYLKWSKKRLGSWTLAAAAYNAGNRRISTRMKEQQAESYYDLYLNLETSRYVFRILALKEILSHPEKYGFIFDKEDVYTYPNTYTIEINKPIPNLATFAKQNGTTYKELKLVNPWLRETRLNNASKKTYKIKIPTQQ